MYTTSITSPDDMHVHFRRGEQLRAVVPFTAQQFRRAIVMPNTAPIIATVDDAMRYRDEIFSAVPSWVQFTPLMTLYLTEHTSPDTIRAAKKSGFIHGIKMYPQGQTTGAHAGVRDPRNVHEQFAAMEEVDLPLLIHGEVADHSVDVFAREKEFYSEYFDWFFHEYPRLRICCEHITTAAVAETIQEAPPEMRIGATITPQHVLANRNYLLGDKLRPHAFCKPVLKTEIDRQAILRAASSGNPRFFLGTDSAPHPQFGGNGTAKECDCGCAGCFTAHAALELYAEAFASVGQLNRLDDFASRFGAEFYELPRNERTVTLRQERWNPSPQYDFGGVANVVVPFRAEVPLEWKLVK